jgi:hypothetical protein
MYKKVKKKKEQDGNVTIVVDVPRRSLGNRDDEKRRSQPSKSD